MQDDVTTLPATRLTRVTTLVMAVGAGVCVANLYYNQPMLGIIAHAMPGPAVSFIPMATQLGYALGLVLLVPLGDRIERRKLILIQMIGVIVAMAAAAAAPNAGALLAASVALGIVSTVAQQIIPLAADLADPRRRGATVGLVMSGLLCGMLLGRTLAGGMSEHFGWRSMFALGSVMAMAITVMFALALPSTRPAVSDSYPRLLWSLFTLVRRHPALLRASVIQGTLFGAFSVFWSVLALRLQAPPFELGSDVAGLFGLVGTVGVLVAPLAGRIADRRGPLTVVGIGTVLVLVSWVVFGVWTGLGGLVAGVLILDLGVQAALISNQAFVYALQPDARSRINTVFMCVMFLGGALGSLLSGIAWHLAGWEAVVMVGAALPAIGLAIHMMRRK